MPSYKPFLKSLSDHQDFDARYGSAFRCYSAVPKTCGSIRSYGQLCTRILDMA